MGAKIISIHYQTTRVLPEPDVFIQTIGGTRFPAHSAILASMSPVLENMMARPGKHRRSKRIIQIHGVPCNAVTAFVAFLYSSRCREDEMDKYGMQLLTLSHAYMVPQLKQKCIKGLIQRLTLENVVDLLQLARLCDAPDLHLKCMKLLTNRFKTVEKTEGWKFLNEHDPWLELDILLFMDEQETRKEIWWRRREEKTQKRVYEQVSKAMESRTVPRGCEEEEEVAVQQILHVSRSSALDQPLCHVQAQDERKVLAVAVQANVASLQTSFLRLSTNPFLQGSALQVN